MTCRQEEFKQLGRREEAPPLRKRNPPPLRTSRQVDALVTELSGVSAREHAQIGVEA